jgi:hypothetical protein
MHNINLSSYIYNIDRRLLYPYKSHTYGRLNLERFPKWESYYLSMRPLGSCPRLLRISSKIILLKFIDFIGMPSFQQVFFFPESWTFNESSLIFFPSLSLYICAIHTCQFVKYSASWGLCIFLLLLLHSISIGVILL